MASIYQTVEDFRRIMTKRWELQGFDGALSDSRT